MKKQTEKKSSEKQTEKKIVAYTSTVDKSAKYNDPLPTNAIRAAYTLAALVVCGFVNVNGSVITSTGNAGNAFMLRAMLGKPATLIFHWLCDASGKVSVSGLNKLNLRMSGQAVQYNTDKDTVAAVLKFVRNGGKGKIGDHAVDFTHKIEFAATAKK